MRRHMEDEGHGQIVHKQKNNMVKIAARTPSSLRKDLCMGWLRGSMIEKGKGKGRKLNPGVVAQM